MDLNRLTNLRKLVVFSWDVYPSEGSLLDWDFPMDPLTNLEVLSTSLNCDIPELEKLTNLRKLTAAVYNPDARYGVIPTDQFLEPYKA